MTQAGPEGGVRRFVLWQVRAEGSGDCWLLLLREGGADTGQ